MLIYIPAFESIWPGVITIVVLKKISSLLLADGVKPEGVTLCACTRLATAAMSMDEAKSMLLLARQVLIGKYLRNEAVHGTQYIARSNAEEADGQWPDVPVT